MRVIEQLIHHFWARGALSREEAAYLVKHGFAREQDLPGFGEPLPPEDESDSESEGRDTYEEQRAANDKAVAAEELEDELVGRNAGSKKGGKKKKPTGHNLAPAVDLLKAHFDARAPYPALLELGSRLAKCADWRAAARAIGSAPREKLEPALVALLSARPRALGELWFWCDLEPLFEWCAHSTNAGPVADALAKLLRATNPANVGRLGQLAKAPEVQALLDFLPARRAFLDLLPVLFHAHFQKLGLWLVPPHGPAADCWPALPWSFVIVYNARHGAPGAPPPGYAVSPSALAPHLLRSALTTALAQAPVAVRELLIQEARDACQPAFARPLHCPFTWRV
jgi:hypothetical protein